MLKNSLAKTNIPEDINDLNINTTGLVNLVLSYKPWPSGWIKHQIIWKQFLENPRNFHKAKEKCIVWLLENCVHKWDVLDVAHFDSTIFAFEDTSEAVSFKLMAPTILQNEK